MNVLKRFSGYIRTCLSGGMPDKQAKDLLWNVQYAEELGYFKNNIEETAKAWVAARSAFINLPMGSPDAKRLLNELSNAEAALKKAVEND